MSQFEHPIPILRIFSEEKAREFYLDYLGFAVDWEHRFADHMPIYMQVSRGNIVLHLSEHHGDSSPGSNMYIPMGDLTAFHAELQAKNYKYLNPAIEDSGDIPASMQVSDPFGNRLRFAQKRIPA